jgi:hypothetical protein
MFGNQRTCNLSNISVEVLINPNYGTRQFVAFLNTSDFLDKDISLIIFGFVFFPMTFQFISFIFNCPLNTPLHCNKFYFPCNFWIPKSCCWLVWHISNVVRNVPHTNTGQGHTPDQGVSQVYSSGGLKCCTTTTSIVVAFNTNYRLLCNTLCFYLTCTNSGGHSIWYSD